MSTWLDQVFCEDALAGLHRIPDGSIDLILTDPPYNLGKDYGNASDQQPVDDFLAWTEQWVDAALPKLKENGSLYVFTTWRSAPEIFVMLKRRMTMINEIIWDRRVPSMGGTVRSFTSVHDTIGFFVRRKDYYFNLDAVRIPYDAETKKARSRSIFVGAKWLEQGYNPKDLWSVSRLHRQHAERVDHPTQKPLEIIERMVKASCPPGGVVLDLFMGSGTTAVAARNTGRHFTGFELNPDYCRILAERLDQLAVEPQEPDPKVRPKRPASPPAAGQQGSDPKARAKGRVRAADPGSDPGFLVTPPAAPARKRATRKPKSKVVAAPTSVDSPE
ncbi:DNA-methyltransferase [Pseudoduganella lutea]|uniref:Methyltransferase n=1 Tax=Pseudoduganella lutea TaxID=321985 RepID=A0A4P6KY45_9BURK|nr:site-specific DNA-methyltransferase [Pseudoduganella lutea]QBE63960.1 site-specific DNA-methyltransferase [Pseudoduganella lutea]